ncbi:hypothetical protein GCM10010052_20390 [Paenarthrobacter histidinolovorans]|nr:hypothetical protein GCM10010052_20390 [Paenarthrobacter histidinolovorans]
MKIERIPENPDPDGQRPSGAVEPATGNQGRQPQRGRVRSIPQNPLVQQLFRLGKRREDAEAKLEKRFAKRQKTSNPEHADPS